MRAQSVTFPRSGRTPRAFVMIEVILALVILGMAIAAFMRSFTQSLDAARRMEIQTQATFFAEQLLGEFEINTPHEGKFEGGFGDDYRNYSWNADIEYEQPDYGTIDGDDNVEQFFALRRLRLEILYNDGIHTPFTAFKMNTAIVGFEKYSYNTKRSYADY